MSDNYAKVKSRKYASDDDAENLLAGILDETEDIAKAEQAKIEAELRAKEDEERLKREATERAKKEEAAARLSAEMERLEKVEQRRTAKLEALKIEDLKERGEWIDPEVERRKLEAKLQEEAELAAMKQAAEEKARRKQHVETQADAGPMSAPTAQQSNNNLMAIGGILLALVVAIGVGAAVMLGGYELDQATYSKAVFAPKDQQVAMVEKSMTAIPKPEPVIEEKQDGTSKPTRRQTSRRAPAAKKETKKSAPISGAPKQNESNKKAKALEDALNTDVFGGF